MGKRSKPSSRRTARALSTAAALGGIGAVTSGVASASVPAGPPGGWDPILTCESGHNPKAQNLHSSASGAFQITDGTWSDHGGRQFGRHAKDATFAQQTIVAERIFAARGLDPWTASEHCWGPKMGKHAVRPAKHAMQPRHTKRYTVRAGDSLSKIAARDGHTWQQLWDLNRNIADPRMIHPGDQIILP